MIGLCVAITMTLWSFFKAISLVIISFDVSGSRAAVGSSAKIRGGFFKKAKDEIVAKFEKELLIKFDDKGRIAGFKYEF